MKKLIHRWLYQRPQLDSHQKTRLSAWQALTKVSADKARYVVVDVEATGLNMISDELISIGAVAVVNGRIVLGDSFYIVMQQRVSSTKENILLHGISGAEQREGESPAEALLAFLEYLGNAPLVAFHSVFDETMIARAMRRYLGLTFKHCWLDLAYVMPSLYPDLMYSHRTLDDWSDNFRLHNEQRHNAVADAMVTAQLYLIAERAAKNKGNSGYTELRGMELAYRSAIGRR